MLRSYFPKLLNYSSNLHVLAFSPVFVGVAREIVLKTNKQKRVTEYKGKHVVFFESQGVNSRNHLKTF